MGMGGVGEGSVGSGDICIFMIDSLCIAEANTIW